MPTIESQELASQEAESHQQESIQQRYQEALDSFVAKVKEDRMVLAAILCGSLSYDTVWEKSDIDLLLIGRDDIKAVKGFCLTENGINIHALLYPRSKFREGIERSLHGSFFHSYFSKSTLLYTTDDSITEYYRNLTHMGARDQEIQLLRAGNNIFPTLDKAEKWLYVKGDLTYSCLWILFTVQSLAQIEVILHGEVIGREVIQQALRLNPELFHALYTDIIHGPKDEAKVRKALDRINAYMDERKYRLFQPVLDFLNEAGGTRSTTEIDEHFKKRAQVGSLASTYEWLADKGIIQKVPVPVRLTEKSRATVDEAAYYYDGGEPL